jgi:ribonuclease HII
VNTTHYDLLEFERPLVSAGEVVVGIDEVGRGALAGPLTVGAVVVLNDAPPPKGLNDSKLLTPARRESLVGPLREWAAAWSLGSVSALEVDAWGLRLALAVAATRALDALAIAPTHALIDGPLNLLCGPKVLDLFARASPDLTYSSLSHTTIVKGDQRSAAIAAAAVLAKVHRDEVMVQLHEEYREYEWASNKGYGAPTHLEALRRSGPCVQHRQSWNLPLERL